MNKKIAVYWGAFDPPQLAHETIAREAINKLWLEKLYIVPSWPHPFKAFKTTVEYRKKINEIFVKTLETNKAELCEVFVDWKRPNTTLETDRYFTELLGFSPYQIFGSDNIESMWKRDPTGEIAMRLPKIIVVRPWFEIDVSKIANFILLNPFDKEDVSYLSSTQVRENIKNNIFEWMNSDIAQYIKENKLYL